MSALSSIPSALLKIVICSSVLGPHLFGRLYYYKTMGFISFVYRNTFRLHENPTMHPEKPERLAAIDRAVAKSGIGSLLINTTPCAASENDLSIVHSPSYIEQIEEAAKRARNENKLIQLDSDTFMSQQTFEVAKLAAGASMTAIDTLAKDDISSSFVAVRPPGHHAMSQRQMGFCIFNNIAIAANYARKHLGHKRVLIIDWDVHHGNGTQDIFYDDPGIFFISMHQYPHWPYETGWLDEVGVGEGKGFNLNIPLPPGTGDQGHLRAWDSIIEPVSHEYKPDIILVSAGYDAHQSDYMSNQNVTTQGFGMLAGRLQKLSQALDIKTACFLEGGYHTEALAESVVATLNALAKAPSQIEEEESITADQAPEELESRLQLLRKQFDQYWDCFK